MNGFVTGLIPGLWRRLHQQRAVLEALAEVGPAGMTPNSLEVTTELTEPRLNAALRSLIADGLVCRQADHENRDRDAGRLSDLRENRYLLTVHADRQL
jgi:DNA-binding MarR family transcriptional regulator